MKTLSTYFLIGVVFAQDPFALQKPATIVSATIDPTFCLYDQEKVTKEIEDLKDQAIKDIRDYEQKTLDEIATEKQKIFKEIEQASECVKKGDTWEIFRGFVARYVCRHTYTDGGKKCKKSDECEGSCITYDNLSQAICEYSNIRGGCFSFIERFPAKICYD